MLNRIFLMGSWWPTRNCARPQRHLGRFLPLAVDRNYQNKASERQTILSPALLAADRRIYLPLLFQRADDLRRRQPPDQKL